MRTLTLTLLAPFAFVAAPALAQDNTSQAPQPVYGPVLEEPQDASPQDDGTQYRVSRDREGCFENDRSNMTFYDDRNGTRMSLKGAGFRLRWNFGEGQEGGNDIPDRCLAQTPMIIREQDASVRIVLAPTQDGPSAQ